MTITDLFGIELPIIQAPMAGSQASALAIAVSNAGGLGSLGCATSPHDVIRKELAAITAGTRKPYNVNFFVHQEPDFDQAREDAWRKTLAPYYKELGADAGTIPGPASRTRFDTATADLLQAFKPPVISFHFGLPPLEMMTRAKAWGSKLISSATTVEEARYLEQHGVDAVIAQGLEAGGHRGMFLTEDLNSQVGTLALVRQIVQAVRVPVIAAGGIADAQGVAAALALGAAGVQVGTAYLVCPEATTSAVHRDALRDPNGVTALTNVFTGRPARSIVNRFIREVGPMSAGAPPFPLAASATVPLRRVAEAAGNREFSPLWSGQNRRAHNLTAAELTRELAAGFVQKNGRK